jgi:hypothetical protein
MTLPTRHNRHAHVCCRLPAGYAGAYPNARNPRRSPMRWANETRLPACDRLKLSSCRSSSMVLAPTCTTSRAVNSYQIAIEPAAAGALPSATSCIAGLPTPADAGCGCASQGSANLYSQRNKMITDDQKICVFPGTYFAPDLRTLVRTRRSGSDNISCHQPAIPQSPTGQCCVWQSHFQAALKNVACGVRVTRDWWWLLKRTCPGVDWRM